MEQVPENEIIQMEDSQVVVSTTTTPLEADQSAAAVDNMASDTDHQDQQHNPATTLPASFADRSDDNDTSFRKALRNARSTETPKELVVQGSLPSWLNGFHYTLSPGIFEIRYPKMVVIDGEPELETRTFTFGHWFDKSTNSRFQEQTTQFCTGPQSLLIVSRRKSESIKDISQTNLQVCSSQIQTRASLLGSCRPVNHKENPVWNLVGPPLMSSHLSTLMVAALFTARTMQTMQVLELNADTLDTGGILTWEEVNPLFKGTQASPHSHFDPVTKELINFTMENGLYNTHYHFFSITEKEPHGSLIASVTAKTSHVHSFAVTPRYIILVLCPLNPSDGGVKYGWGASILEAMTFKASEPTLFHVISRVKRKHIATFKSDAFFFFHQVNAFEDAADNVYLDLAMYSDDTIAHQLSLPSLLDGSAPPLTKPELCRIELANVQAEAQRLEDYNAAVANTGPVDKLRGLMRRVSVNHSSGHRNQETALENTFTAPMATRIRSLPGVELARINPIYHGLDYKYTWGIGLLENGSGNMYDCIMKLHVKGDAEPTVWSQKNCYPSEAIFVPPPVFDQDEDAGVVISIVYDAEASQSFVLVLDAKDLTEKGRAVLPEIVPLSFTNGCFAPDDVSRGMQPAHAPETISDDEDDEDNEND
ncbi:carotenoid oxygenase [Mortierella sp. GBAus27b]|nr:carotenoid oxygenase [Mortierella sp. GBAus27b]